MTIATVSAMAIGGAMSAYSQISAGQAAAAQAEANARLARGNAAIVQQEGAATAAQAELHGRQVAAGEAVALAGNGAEISSGSAAETIGQTSLTSELDAMTARNNAARKAWGYDVEAATDDAASEMARTRSILGAVGTGIGTLGSMASTGAAMHGRQVAIDRGYSGPSSSDWFNDG
jgi:hypothetical protein